MILSVVRVSVARIRIVRVSNNDGKCGDCRCSDSKCSHSKYTHLRDTTSYTILTECTIATQSKYDLFTNYLRDPTRVDDREHDQRQPASYHPRAILGEPQLGAREAFRGAVLP